MPNSTKHRSTQLGLRVALCPWGGRSPAWTTVGMLAASIEPLENFSAVKTRLHLGAVYTIPAARRKDIARQLIQEALEWGQRMNATEANLNVLVANPARQLYEQLGFRPHEISMVKKLNRSTTPASSDWTYFRS